MNLYEKIEKICEWCDNCTDCVECPLFDETCYGRNGYMKRPEIVDHQYSLLFGEGTDEEHESVSAEEHESDSVNHPSHYQGKNECIDVMVAMFGVEAVKHFCMCNAYKYRFRADKKNGEEDIEKAEWYETKLIELGGIDGRT